MGFRCKLGIHNLVYIRSFPALYRSIEVQNHILIEKCADCLVKKSRYVPEYTHWERIKDEQERLVG